MAPTRTSPELAALGFAPNHAKRLVLLSDGNQTDGDVWRRFAQLQMQGVRVFAVPASVLWTTMLGSKRSKGHLACGAAKQAMVRVRVFARTDGGARVGA